MKFAQIGKRVFLFLIVNILVMITINIVVGLFLRGRFEGYGMLAMLCLVYGMAGALISLAISRWMAKMMMGVQVIDPVTADSTEQRLLGMVENLARSAGLEKMPEVGIYESPEINAFATGPSRNRSLVAVSSGLLRNMRQSDVEGVLGHEIAHIANGDMVTMTLLQGIVNAFALFLAQILAMIVASALSKGEERRGDYFLRWILAQVFQVVLMIFGTMVIAAFSRWREYRADAGGAQFAGRSQMIGALRALQAAHEVGADQIEGKQPAFQALKISGKTSTVAMLFASHPPLEKRIARLENLTVG